MRKNLIGIIILAVLAVLAYFLLNEEALADISGKENHDYKDFAIEDTTSIDKIFLSQSNGKRLLLTKDETGEWKVNNRFPARKDAVNLILKTVHDVQVLSPVSKKYFESTVKRLATGATKVEFYQGEGEPSKIWYIGDATASKVGTYMLLEKEGVKSSKPYIMHRLLERGHLGTRFFLDPTLWKDRLMIKVEPQEVKRIRVEHANDTMVSFEINQLTPAKFEITNLENGQVNSIDAKAAIPYFKNFAAVYYEYLDIKTPATILDSIFSSLPRHKIEVELNDGKKIAMRTHYLPVNSNAELNGKPIYFHPERMYAYTSELGEDVHLIVQNLTFDILVPSFTNFESLTTVEK